MLMSASSTVLYGWGFIKYSNNREEQQREEALYTINRASYYPELCDYCSPCFRFGVKAVRQGNENIHGFTDIRITLILCVG